MDIEQSKKYKDLLRRYLRRYTRAMALVEVLRQRRIRFIQDNKYPLGAQQYSGMPSNNSPSEGSAGYSFRLSEIEERIYAQKKEAEKILYTVMDIMDLLPVDDEDRSVLELRYIDNLSDKEIIRKKVYGNRSTVSYHINCGLDKLLQFQKVIKVLDDYEKVLQNKGSDENNK